MFIIIMIPYKVNIEMMKLVWFTLRNHKMTYNYFIYFNDIITLNRYLYNKEKNCQFFEIIFRFK